MRKNIKLLFAGFLFLVIAAPAVAQEISSEARRHMIRGEAAMELAESQADLMDAVREFRKATELAPDWADAWFNLGVALDEAGDVDGAIRSYKKYLSVNPGASDKAEIEILIIKLEYKAEKAQRNQRKNSAEAQRARFLQGLSGDWKKGRYCGEMNTTVKVRGNSIEIAETTKGPRGSHYAGAHLFRGTIKGLKIEGTVQIDWSSFKRGRLFNRPFEGKIAQDGKTIWVYFDEIIAGDMTGLTVENWVYMNGTECKYHKVR